MAHPTIDAAKDKMPPPGMKGNIQRRVGPVRYREHDVRYSIHAIEINRKVSEAIAQTNLEHLLCARADRFRREK